MDGGEAALGVLGLHGAGGGVGGEELALGHIQGWDGTLFAQYLNGGGMEGGWREGRDGKVCEVVSVSG